MKHPPKSSAKNSNQHKKFIETARALGCDESPEVFAAKLKAMIGIKPKKKPQDAGSPTAPEN